MMNQNMMYQNMMNNPMMNQNMMSQMMMAQLMANNGNNSQNNDSQSQSSNNNSNMNSNGGFTVIFRTRDTDNSDPISVQCMPNDRVSEVIEKYRSKANDHDETKRFIFNAKELDKSLTVAEAGLQDRANVFVINTKGVKGA